MTARGAPSRTTLARAPAGRGKVRPLHTAHERQAEAAGAAFARGATGLGATLTAAPAARLRLPGAVPRALPATLRGQLEQAYCADLSGLRIFDDSAAHAAAHAFGARAFTAGADLYFAQGAWQPGRADGRARIAHEVAHALQQSGRAASAGRVRLEPGVAGDAGVQRDPDAWQDTPVGQAVVSLLPPIQHQGRLDILLRHDTPHGRIDAALAKPLRAAIALPAPAEALAAVDEVLRPLVDAQRTPIVRALFCDLFKLLGADQKAAEVAGKEPPTMTAVGSWSYYLHHRQGDAAWVVDLLRTHADTKRWFPNAIVRAARLDFLGMPSRATPLAAGDAFETALVQAINRAHDYNPTMMPEERRLVAFVALKQFDKHRRKRYGKRAQEAATGESLELRAGRRLEMIRLYAAPDRLVADAREDGLGPEVERIAAEVGRLLAPVAARAVRYWQAVEKMRGALMPDRKHPREFLQLETMMSVVKTQLPAIGALARLGDRLAPAYAEALKLQADQVPADNEQKWNRFAAGDRTDELVTQVEQQAADDNLKKYGEPANGSDDLSVPDAAMSDEIVRGAIILMLGLLHDVLKTPEPMKLPKDSGRADLAPDRALGHYVQMARLLAGFAKRISLDELAAKTDDIAEAGGKTPPASSIGLLAPFAPHPATLAEFGREFSHGAFRPGGSLTGSQMIEWAFLMYHEDMLVELAGALGQVTAKGIQREFDSDPTLEPAFNTATKAVQQHGHQPRRYRVAKEATLLHVHEDDKTEAGKLVADTHPLRAEVMRNVRHDDLAVTPRDKGYHEDGFVTWILPDMTRLANVFAAIPGIVDLVGPDGKTLGPVSAAESGTAWLIRLNNIVGVDPKKQAALADAIHTREASAVRKLEPLYRRATNNERKKVGVLLAEQWDALPKTFLRGTENYMNVPRQALKFTQQFLSGVLPDRPIERRLQMTALMLELAPVLHDALSGTDRLDILLQWHGDLVGAAKFAASPEFEKEHPLLLTGLDAAATAARIKTLTRLGDGFRDTALSQQATRDLEASADDNTLTTSDSRFSIDGGHQAADAPPPEGATFISDAVVYTLTKVHNSFRYQPEMMVKESVQDWGRTLPLGTARLWVNGTERFPGEPPVKLASLTVFANNREEKWEITSADTVALSKLTWAVHQHFFGKDMAALGDVLDTLGHHLISAMQILFPEFATEMAYAEIGASIVQFFGDADFQILKGALDNDSGGLFDASLGKLKDILDPDNLWAWFLMGNMPPELNTLSQVAGAIGRLRQVGHKGDEKTRSTTSKVLGRLLGVGAIVLKDVMRVHEAVQYPATQFSEFVQGSPVLQAALRLAAKELEGMENLSLSALADRTGADLLNELREMYRHFVDIIRGLGAFELPKELIPLHDIIEMVVNMVIDFLPSKYSYPIRTSRKVDAVESLFQWIFNKVADLLIEHGLDPNQVWQRFAADLINPLLKDAGEAVATAATSLLDKVPGISDLNAWAGIETPTPETHFVAEGGGDANQTASPKTQVAGAMPATPPKLPQDGGRALDSISRGRAERGYGHDFGHVRLHQGDAVDRALRDAGALAATSGSHVYIDSAERHQPDLLNHELAHVLQQAGPRPLGERHAGVPTRATAPGGGWRVDPSAEAQADALAMQAREPADAPRPVRRSAGAGLQPKIDLQSVIGNFFKLVGDPTKLREGAQHLADKVIDPKAMAQAAPELSNTLYEQLSDHLLHDIGRSPVSFDRPLKLIDTLMVDYVLNNHETPLKAAMPHLLMGGLQEIEYGPRKARKSFWIVNPEHLKVKLQQYFFGVTGISVEFEFNTLFMDGPDKKKHKTVTEKKSFAKIHFVHLHLPMIGGGAKLWNEIMGNSFDMNAADTDRMKLKARHALSSLDPGVGIFSEGAGGKLKFSKKAMDAIKNEFLGGMSGKLDPNKIPKYDAYVDPDTKTPSEVSSQVGQIGLRMGLYRDKGKLDGQRGIDRESHHTVQYLLVEYFSNTLQNKPFPAPLKFYPNVSGKGRQVTLIAAEPDGKKGIHIEASTKRGPDMPVLLLAAATHRSGVHVTATADEDGGSATQSTQVHEWWTEHLGKYAPLVLGSDNRDKLETLMSFASTKKATTGSIRFNSMTVTRKDLADAIHDATNKTYNEMRSDMNKKLEAKIDLHEKKYYEDIVKQATEPKIFAKGKAQPGYEWRPVKNKLMPKVKERQKSAFDSDAFGFTTQ